MTHIKPIAALATTLALLLLAAPANASLVQTAEWGSLGSGDGEFDEPVGIATQAGSGFVFVADDDNNRVQGFDPLGNFLGLGGVNGTLESHF